MAWKYIGLWTLAAAVVCVAAAALLRLQRIGAKPNLINVFAGLALNNGFRLTRRFRLTGDRQLMTATLVAWVIWTLLGGAIIALVAPGYNPRGMYLVYGALCGLAGAVVGCAIGLACGMWYAKATNMSSFEGKSGYFVVLIGLLGGMVGGLAAGIGMAMFFYYRGH
jgi:hypothetical protein